MTTSEDEMRTAMAAHKAGRFADAEAGYRRILQERPKDPKALYYLGLLQFHRGHTESALDLMRQCVTLAPSNAHAWNTLGGICIAAGLGTEAREAYRRMTVVAPAMGEGWYNLGICLRDEGDVEGALSALRTSLAKEPDYFRAHEALATLLYQLGRVPEAADIYRDWAARDPQNPTARHMAAATSQQDVPARAADDYVRSLFDRSAKSFDSDLTRLGYRAPALVAEALQGGAAGQLQNVLDAGCGTGLCGPLVRSQCAHLVGVDLSSQMIERARERACYDDLVVAELSSFMRTQPGGFDAIISADTLVYFGALEEPLRAAREALRPGGVFVFTLESRSNEGGGVDDAGDASGPRSPRGSPGADFALEAHGRYAHSESYIHRSLTDAGFDVIAVTRETLREERDQRVAGFLIVAR